MVPVDLNAPANVLVIPHGPGGTAALARHDLSVARAIRYVVEELPAADEQRAVVRTPTLSMFINEIEALYEQPEFAKPSRIGFGMSGTSLRWSKWRR